MKAKDDGVLFYRCELCKTVVSPWDIRQHFSCPKCGQVRVRQTNLSLWEKLVQIAKHPKVWEWKNVV